MEIFTEYDHPSALASLHCRALNEFSTLSKGKKPYSLTVTLGDELKFTWKFTLERMREDLRDGRSAEYTLGVHSDSILSMAENGKSGFFEELGDTLRKHRREPFTRNLSEWIVRAWLPLCLWECEPDGFDAHERFCSAAELLELDFARKDNARFLVQFVDAWRNVRSKKLNQPKKLQ